jgi:hypothetical protein
MRKVNTIHTLTPCFIKISFYNTLPSIHGTSHFCAPLIPQPKFCMYFPRSLLTTSCRYLIVTCLIISVIFNEDYYRESPHCFFLSTRFRLYPLWKCIASTPLPLHNSPGGGSSMWFVSHQHHHKLQGSYLQVRRIEPSNSFVTDLSPSFFFLLDNSITSFELDDRIYRHHIQSSLDYRQLHRYRCSTHFTVHRYTRTRVLSLH